MRQGASRAWDLRFSWFQPGKSIPGCSLHDVLGCSFDGHESPETHCGTRLKAQGAKFQFSLALAAKKIDQHSDPLSRRYNPCDDRLKPQKWTGKHFDLIPGSDGVGEFLCPLRTDQLLQVVDGLLRDDGGVEPKMDHRGDSLTITEES